MKIRLPKDIICKSKSCLSFCILLCLTLFCITDFFPAYADSDGHICKIKEHGISITIPGSYIPLERGYSPSEFDAFGLSATYEDYDLAFSDQDLYVDAIRSVPYAEILLHVNDGTGLTSLSSMSQADLRRQASDIVKELEAAGWETLSTSNFTSGPLQYIVLEYSGGGFRFLLYMTVFQEKIVSLRYQTGLTQAISSSELAEIQGIVRSISFSALQNKAVLVTVSITLVMLLICFVLIDGIKKSVHPRPDSVNDEHDGEEPKQSGLHGVGRLLQKIFNTQWFFALIACGAFLFLVDLSNNVDSIQQYFDMAPREIRVCFLLVFLAFIVLSVAAIVVASKAKNNEKNDHIRKLQDEQNNRTLVNESGAAADSILYLRPFRTDANSTVTKYVDGEKTVSRNPVKKYINSFGEVEYRGEKYTNFEALLCKAVEEKGIPVAIGDPNEKINDDSPNFGAVRIYADDDTWKQIVEDYFTNSKAVVLYVDFTDGVKWELNQAINKYQDKVIFVPKLYNKHVSFLKTLAKFPLTALFTYPFYFVFVKLLLLPHYHRGRAYYRQWKTQFGFRISDKICAVIFESEKPVFYYTQFGDIESQLEIIVHAIQGKSQTNDAEKVVLGENAVSFPMTVYRQEYDHWTHRILPDGAFTFGLNGIRYQHVGIISVLVSLTKYIISRPIMKSEILYQDIYEVRPNKKARRIDLVTNAINGYYYLYPSRFLAVYLSDIAEYIEKCRSAAENDAEKISLTERMMKIAETMERDSCLAAFIYMLMSPIAFFRYKEVILSILFASFAVVSARFSQKRWAIVAAVAYEILLLAYIAVRLFS